VHDRNPRLPPRETAKRRVYSIEICCRRSGSTALDVRRQAVRTVLESYGRGRSVEGRNRGSRPLSPECVRSPYDVIDLAPVTASSIRKTFTSRLDLWLNPILDSATAKSDFDLRALRSTPMSIYVGVNPDDLHRLRRVLNLFFQQAIASCPSATLP